MPSNESIKDYNVYEQLGQGGFAQVYRAQVKESSKEVAIKMVSAHFFYINSYTCAILIYSLKLSVTKIALLQKFHFLNYEILEYFASFSR
jgi:serine/threonine protein kinase